MEETMGMVFEIQRFSYHDGPGIRTTVFFKGCPLRCQWCHNPEGLTLSPDLMVREKNCIECFSCSQVCPTAATLPAYGKVSVNRDECTVCGECESVCPNEGLEVVGRERSARDVVAEVMKDVDYFKTSGGGVTLSGGEVMMQPKFAMAILSLAKQMNLSTCVETSCYTRASVLSPFLEKVDHWMVDIKAFDDELHRKLTGVSNRMILQNIMALSQADASLILRLPIIPSLNDHRDNLLACADYILSLPSKPKEVQLLPYHSMGESKKTLLGQDIDAATRFQTPTDEMVRNWHECFKERGVETASPEG